MGSASGTNKGTHFELRKLSNSYYITIIIEILGLLLTAILRIPRFND